MSIVFDSRYDMVDSVEIESIEIVEDDGQPTEYEEWQDYALGADDVYFDYTEEAFHGYN